MDSNKIKKIAIIAFIFSIFAFSIGGSTTTFYNNTTNNITNNVTNNFSISDNTKINKSGDSVANPFYLYSIDSQYYTTYGVLQLTSNLIDLSLYNATTSNFNSGFKAEESKSYLYYAPDSELGVNINGSYSTVDFNMQNNSINNAGNITIPSTSNYLKLYSRTAPTNNTTEIGGTGQTNTNGGTNLYYGHFNLTEGGNVSMLGINIQGTSLSKRVQMGIYSDNANSPYQLLANTSNTTAITGWLNITLNKTINLPAGRSWVAFESEATQVIWYMGLVQDGSYYSPNSFGYMPNTATVTGATVTSNIRIYYWYQNPSILYCIGVNSGGSLYTIPC